jgi:hypothetical protein
MSNEKILIILKEIVLSDFITKKEKEDIFNLILSSTEDPEYLYNLLKSFLTAKIKSNITLK